VSTSDPSPELPRVKSRLPFDPQPFKAAARPGILLVYAALTIGLAGVAVYMALAGGRPLTSAYVAGPGIGALWFGLRLFMIWGSSNARG